MTGSAATLTRLDQQPKNTFLSQLTGAAGILSALVLLVNAAKRSAVIPTSSFTQLVAPLAQALAIVFVAGLFITAGRRTATGILATVANVIALASLVGVEFVINLVFAQLDTVQISALRSGSLGVALTVASMGFLLASWAFVAVMLVSGQAPRIPLALYAVAVAPISLRSFVPAWALNGGLVVLALAIAWLAIWLVAGSRANGAVARRG